MPWEPADALTHNKSATTAHKQKIWAAVANHTRETTGDDGAAVRAANSVLKHMSENPPAANPRTPAAGSSGKPTRVTARKSALGPRGMKPHWSGH
jgi:hypothetical protein